jgi:prepilin signal peptidase PulO-like enzyme (type II secretory pathway)
MMGSFFNVLFSRGDWYKGRSRCDFCANQLVWFELIPVISFVWQRGRCRHCGQKIDVFHILAEIFMGCGFAVAATFFHQGYLEGVTVLTVTFFLCIFAISDMKTKTIPVIFLNAGIVCTGLLKLFTFTNWHESFTFLISAIVFYVLCLIFGKITRKYMGEGDYDIFTMLYLFFGLYGTIMCIATAAMIGVCVYLPLIIAKKRNRNEQIPFAPLLYVAFLLMLIWSWFINFMLN